MSAYEEGVPRFQAYLEGGVDNRNDEYKKFGAQCIACRHCDICSQPLRTFEIELDLRERQYDDNGREVVWWWNYYHKLCFEQKRKIEAEKQRLAEEGRQRQMAQAAWQR